MFHEPMDSELWQLVALAAGTGGSMLAVGSVAGGSRGLTGGHLLFPGVTLMGLEHVGFLWYMKRISPWAALGFAAGMGTAAGCHKLRWLRILCSSAHDCALRALGLEAFGGRLRCRSAELFASNGSVGKLLLRRIKSLRLVMASAVSGIVL